MTTKPKVACSLIINVARGDTPILEYTLPHILDSHVICFAEVVVVVDEQVAQGRIRERYPQYSVESLYLALDRVRERGYKFREEAVSYRDEDLERVFSKWFGHSRMTCRCAGGTPIYAFLYGLETARYDFRLHLDSDMLIYDPGPRSWVQKAVELLETVPEILFVNQTWGLQTEESPAPASMPTTDLGYGQNVSQVFSSRCFFFSDEKLHKSFLPLETVKHPFMKRILYRLQKRSPYVALEQMISRTLFRTNTYRADLKLAWGLNLHAWDKEVFRHADILDVISQIEMGQIPIEHLGQYNLDFAQFLQ